MESWDTPTKVDIGAAKRARDDYSYQRQAEGDAEYRRMVAFHIDAWSSWEHKTPRPVFSCEFENEPTKEIRK